MENRGMDKLMGHLNDVPVDRVISLNFERMTFIGAVASKLDDMVSMLRQNNVQVLYLMESATEDEIVWGAVALNGPCGAIVWFLKQLDIVQ